jgi:hypothetical protein
MDAFKDALLAIIQGLILDFDARVTQAQSILGLNPQAQFPGAYGVAQNFSKIMAVTGASVLAIFYLIDLIKTAVRFENIRFEAIIGVMVKLAIAKSAMDIVPDFMLAMVQTGSGWAMQANGLGGLNSATFMNSVGNVMVTIFQDSTWYQALALSVSMMILFLGVNVCGILIVVMAYARAFEIILYIAVAPLPFSFMLMDNGQVAKRFALQFAGVLLQGALMSIIIQMYFTFGQDLISQLPTPGVNTDVWAVATALTSQMLLGVLVLVASIMKSGSLSKQMLSA